MRKIDLFKVSMSYEASSLVAKTLMSGFIGQGERVEEYEKLLREWFDYPYINTANSATSGLHLAVRLTEGEEIITTPLTCFATNSVILANNRKIKWADVDPKTCNVDLDDVERKITDKTAAVMVVHWGGHACDLDRLKQIRERVPVIEDCAHAWGAKFDDKLVGTHGNMAVFSFQAIKHLNNGDGGCIISPNEEIHKKIKLLRWYGLDRESNLDYRCAQNIKDWGYKFHMNDINASIGIANINLSKSVVCRHKENGRFFDEALKGISGVTLLEMHPKAESSYWIYTVKVKDRDNFVKKMTECGIATSQVHARNDGHDCVKEFKTDLPNLDVLSKEICCIPCGWWVDDEDREYIVDCVKKGW